VTLLKIMTIIQDIMCGSVGDTLGDIEVCEMLETVLTTCCQMRLSGTDLVRLAETNKHAYSMIHCSEILRRSAEATMHALVKTAFSRLYTLNPDDEERKLADNDGPTLDGEVKLSVSASVTSPSAMNAQALVPEMPKELKEPATDVPRAQCNVFPLLMINLCISCYRWFTIRLGAPSGAH
jgi:hypothetical protein